MGAREAARGSAEGLGMVMAIGHEMELQDIPPAVQCPTEQTAEADALLKEVDTAIVAIPSYKQQLEEVWALLNHQRNNIPLEFVKEGEETFEGWKKELYDIASLQRLDETGRAQVEVDLHLCARLLQDVRRMFAELRAAAERSCLSGVPSLYWSLLCRNKAMMLGCIWIAIVPRKLVGMVAVRGSTIWSNFKITRTTYKMILAVGEPECSRRGKWSLNVRWSEKEAEQQPPFSLLKIQSSTTMTTLTGFRT
ncbi:hypothetical protein CBR_g21004 [Chara braunii]|uniref:Uncharacterized protein n=1 Tax=Chara braunii TaxID=69332 RepID=A0A388L0C3_CHABU|nr:hypothetical protein CBR_g21004 [Chara braunii]|eukprot:GBG75759.1 hypothetical protein CBR_g21004 [Chara braunii]